MLHVALYQPSIPPNTGNIARQCVGMKARLHLIGPIEFDLSGRAVKRAGLDYWKHLDLQRHESPAAFLEWLEAHGVASGWRPGKGHARGPWLLERTAARRYHGVAKWGLGDSGWFGCAHNPQRRTVQNAFRRVGTGQNAQNRSESVSSRRFRTITHKAFDGNALESPPDGRTGR